LHPCLLDYDGESIALPNNSIDAVVCTLVLCTVKDPQKILSEIHRVLKPHGKFFFIEHVAAVNNEARLRLQRYLEPIWKIIGRGCHLTRNTEQSIIQAGFQFQELNRQSMRGMPAIVRPSIRGCAIK
jgi:ubiquinone/menaquinone biosynthesis C-methylase UbiE